MALILVFISFSHAKTLTAEYEVGFGILGQIGTAKAVLKQEKTSYTIDIRLASTGLAKTLSRGRTERHLSSGHLENEIMVADRYEVIRSDSSSKVVKRYEIDHKQKKVFKTYQKFKKGKLVSQEKSILDFYAKDDLLTLYFNLNTLLKDKTTRHSYAFKAVGAERQGGRISLIIPEKNELPEYQKTVGKNALWYATAIIHQKIFSSKEGELMLAIGQNGITQKAVLKDVILFGDIRATRVR
ncbi:MAG: DUF3108 domain-containing protein [Campylobacterales bacterium]|nr:DUF3108 domain-containing protein [Campylobacterales bacterium]